MIPPEDVNVSSVMTRDVVAVEDDTPLVEVAQLMARTHIHHAEGQNREISRGLRPLENLYLRELQRLEASAVLFQGSKQEVNEEQLEQLRALGYIE